MKKSIIHAVEGGIIMALGYVPFLVQSDAVRSFIANHPADAVYLPIAVGVASALYRKAKAKWGAKAAPIASK